MTYKADTSPTTKRQHNTIVLTIGAYPRHKSNTPLQTPCPPKPKPKLSPTRAAATAAPSATSSIWTSPQRQRHPNGIVPSSSPPLPSHPTPPRKTTAPALIHYRSNCSICLKTNRLSITIPNPDTEFKLLSPAALASVPSYQFGPKSQHYRFCDKCGIHVFAYGSYVYEGQEVKNFSINAVTLDADQGVDLRAFKMGYWDGKAENWEAGEGERPYPGGSH